VDLAISYFDLDSEGSRRFRPVLCEILSRVLETTRKCRIVVGSSIRWLIGNMSPACVEEENYFIGKEVLRNKGRRVLIVFFGPIFVKNFNHYNFSISKGY